MDLSLMPGNLNMNIKSASSVIDSLIKVNLMTVKNLNKLNQLKLSRLGSCPT